MARKTRFGRCKLCEKKDRLSFEHVPPKCTFNNSAVKVIPFDQIIGNNDRMPWELHGLKGEIQQKGMGGYYLCSQCNSTTGSWYIPYYEEFVKGILYVLQKNGMKESPAWRISISRFRPLPIIKQIMLMFCDINNNCFGDDDLRSFLIDKDQREGFNTNKYKLYAYITMGPLNRHQEMQVHVQNVFSRPRFITVSEIASPPIGFALYIDLPEDYTPKGALINSFADYDYDVHCNGEIVLPMLECYTPFAGDYRGKKEISDLVELNKEYSAKEP